MKIFSDELCEKLCTREAERGRGRGRGRKAREKEIAIVIDQFDTECSLHQIQSVHQKS